MKSLNIKLPHINYTVRVRPWKMLKDPKWRKSKALFWATGKCVGTLYFRNNPPPSTIAHELIHVLQHICESNNMDFCYEIEHMAYIMQYLMIRIQGYEYANEPLYPQRRDYRSTKSRLTTKPSHHITHAGNRLNRKRTLK